MNAPTGLTSLQLELLKVFSMQINEAQLLEIRTLLSNYFADKATAEMDKERKTNKGTISGEAV